MRVFERKRAMSSIVLLCLLLAACTPNEPFLWKVDDSSYLFGTIHLSDERVLNLHPDVKSALVSVDYRVLELQDAAFDSRSVLLLETDLREMLAPNMYERLYAYYTRHGHPEVELDFYRPWWIALQLPLLNAPQGKTLDQILRTDSSLGLETMEEQIAVFDSVSREEQIQYLRATLDQVEAFEQEGKVFTEELLLAYLSGDETKLQNVLNTHAKGFPLSIEKAFIEDRNARMAERIHSLLQNESTYFIAVGTAHLIGEDSIPTLLQKQGHTVVRIS